MELRQYVTLLRKWFWLVILLAVIAAALQFCDQQAQRARHAGHR